MSPPPHFWIPLCVPPHLSPPTTSGPGEELVRPGGRQSRLGGKVGWGPGVVT